MSEKVLNVRQIQKHDLEVNWRKAASFVPKCGEIIVYDAEEVGQTAQIEGLSRDFYITHTRVKIGDGKTVVNELEFFKDGGAQIYEATPDTFYDILAMAEEGSIIKLLPVNDAETVYPELDLKMWDSQSTNGGKPVYNTLRRKFNKNITIVGSGKVTVEGVNLTSGLSMAMYSGTFTQDEYKMSVIPEGLTFKNIHFSKHVRVYNCDITNFSVIDCVFNQMASLHMRPNRISLSETLAVTTSNRYVDAIGRLKNTLVKGNLFKNEGLAWNGFNGARIQVGESDGIAICNNTFENAAYNAVQVSGTVNTTYSAIGLIEVYDNIIKETVNRPLRFSVIDNAQIKVTGNYMDTTYKEAVKIDKYYNSSVFFANNIYQGKIAVAANMDTDWANDAVKGNHTIFADQTDFVSYNTQTLSEEQQAQARQNIGAAAVGETGGAAEEAILYTPQTLSTEQKAQARTNIGVLTYEEIKAKDAAPVVYEARPDTLVSIIKNAKPGSTVKLMSGTYEKLELIGKDSFPENLTIQGGVYDNYDAHLPGLLISCGLHADYYKTETNKSASILPKGLTFTGVCFNKDVIVENCEIDGLSFKGCYFDNGARLYVVPNIINKDNESPSYRYQHVATQVKNFTLSGSTFVEGGIGEANYGKIAFYIADVDGLTVYKNAFNNYYSTNIMVSSISKSFNSGNFDIRDNVFVQSYGRAIEMWALKNASVFLINNTIHSANTHGEFNEYISIDTYGECPVYISAGAVANTYNSSPISEGNGISVIRTSIPLTELNNIIMADTTTGEKYKLYIENGSLKMEVVE